MSLLKRLDKHFEDFTGLPFKRFIREAPVPFNRFGDDNFGGREWIYKPSVTLNKKMLHLGIELHLTRLDGKPTDMIGRYAYFQIRRKWEPLQQDHIYYDGPHCSYIVGPFQLHFRWNECRKCHGDWM